MDILRVLDYFNITKSMNISFLLRTTLILIICSLLSIQDLKEYKISNYKIIIAIIIIFILDLFEENNHRYFISSIIITFIFLITKLIMKNRLGWGDILFAIFTGLCIYPAYALLSVIISVLCAFIMFIIKNKEEKKGEQKQIAFIPFMSLGLIISYFISFL